MTSFISIIFFVVLSQEILFAREIQADIAVKLGYLLEFAPLDIPTSAHLDLPLIIEACIGDVPGDIQVAHSFRSRYLLSGQAVAYLIVDPGAIGVFLLILESTFEHIFVLHVAAHLVSFFAFHEPV